LSLGKVNLTRPLADYPRVPLDPILRATVDDTINFLELYRNYAVDVLITNLDVANPLVYFMNGSQVGSTVPAGGAVFLSNVILYRLRITSNAVTGAWDVTPLGVSYDLLVKR